MRAGRRTTRWFLGMLAVGLTVGFFGAATAAGSGMVVTVDEPFVVDGQVYPAGKLSLRPVRAFTPTTTLNEVWVGKRCLGLLATSRSDAPSLEASRNAVLFVRDADGRLVLRGYAYRVDGTVDRYRYALLDTPKVAASTVFDHDAPSVLIAARTSR